MMASLNSTSPPAKSQTPIDDHTSEEEEATTTIDCSSDVSQSRILGDLMQARSVPGISSITLQDLVRSKHHCMMPLVKALAASSTRTWDSFRFEDTVDLADFETWQVLRDEMIEDYEQTSYEREEEGPTSFLHVMTWQANVTIPVGTPVQDIVRFLRRVQSDDEVYQVTFGGTLGEMFSVLVPDVLGGLIDKQNFVLENEIVVQVACGWLEVDSDWMELLDDCVASLRERLPVSHLSLKKRWDASTCSISSYSESFMGSAGNLSLKSVGTTSYTGYASFYDESCFEASQNGLNGAGEGNATWSSTKNSSLSLANAFFGEASINSLSGDLLNGSSAQLFPGNGVPKAA